MENNKIIAKAEIFDRIEQSFELFKNNFLWLFLPIFLYTFFTVTLFMNIVNYFLINFWEKFWTNWTDILSIFENSYTIIAIVIFIHLAILYVTLYIIFILATIKWVKQAYNWEIVNYKENIKYWFKNLFESFKTYWYIFAYVALIPAMVWIIWWLFSIYWMHYNNDDFTKIWIFFSIFALIFFIFFSIYRWTKSNFAISSAVDKNIFNKQNFDFSIKITKNNFWRIFWNFLLLRLIIWFATWIVNQIIWLFGSSFDFNIEDMINLKDSHNPEAITNFVHNTLSSYSPLKKLLLDFLSDIIATISSVFLLIFTYIFFKRLEIENNPETEKEENIQEKIEL